MPEVTKPDLTGRRRLDALRTGARITLAWDDSVIEVFHEPRETSREAGSTQEDVLR